MSIYTITANTWQKIREEEEQHFSKGVSGDQHAAGETAPLMRDGLQ